MMPTIGRCAAGLLGLWQGPGWDRERIQAFQAWRLRQLVHHAYSRVAHYRRLFDQAGLKPEHIRTLRDLERIPLTSRFDLQRLPARDVVARGFEPDRLAVHRTSGSSGEPLNIRRTGFEDRLLRAYRLREFFRLGLRLGDRWVAVVSPRLTATQHYRKTGLLRYEEIDCRWPPERILSRLREAPPDVLRGYPGTLSWLAGYLTDSDRERIRPRFITTGAETMTSDMRAAIREGFRARVSDFYGSFEFNMIASECLSSGLYHVSDQSVIVEVLRDGRPAAVGEEGELVGTALHSWAMPFIRYRLGDLVSRGPDRCICGAPNLTLAEVHGRVVDRFSFPGGHSVHPYTLVRVILSNGGWVRRFQIIQETVQLIRVKLVALPGEDPPAGGLADIRRILSERLGTEVLVEVDVVDQIPAAPNGKFRPYFSMVSGPCARS